MSLGALQQAANQMVRELGISRNDDFGMKLGVFIDHQTMGWRYMGSENAQTDWKNMDSTLLRLFDKVNGYTRPITYYNATAYLLKIASDNGSRYAAIGAPQELLLSMVP